MKMETERLYIRHFVNEDASICFEGWGQMSIWVIL